jgi:hypothetical protein
MGAGLVGTGDDSPDPGVAKKRGFGQEAFDFVQDWFAPRNRAR